MENNSLGARIKSYEDISNIRLIPRMPVILRVDGKSFHTFTKKFDRPFDEQFMISMAQTMKYLCENIQGVKFGYTQSDEISILLTDYEKYTTERWFDYRIQKMTSVAASIATAKFNELIQPYRNSKKLNQSFALFDARVFSLSKEEVCNYFIWRQQDATKNSIQMLARSLFSHKELQNLNGNDLQNKMLVEKNINWNDLPIYCKRGISVYKNSISGWYIDKVIPVFSDLRDFVETWI